MKHLNNNTLPVCEIFGPTFQGEGLDIGMFTIFIRLGGCDFKCVWCDSIYAVDTENYKNTWEKMNVEQIFEKIHSLYEYPCRITISGGNPALYDLSNLINYGKKLGYQFAIETQGSQIKDYFSKLDSITLSPKPPSAKVNFDIETLYKNINNCNSISNNLVLKVVVFDDDDYEWAKNLHLKYKNLPFVMQVGNSFYNNNISYESLVYKLNKKLRILSEKVLKDKLQGIRVLPQLHVYIWGNEKGK